ncbi:MAG: hypothetical protein A2776_00740 [Candidatus Levybacteria bacterium RIFCSPHIGHO2_01_FULL_40_10]|nr:MAG: hypothetical protein A2776_00740 [Candidatus Levybacteria bacterium RIFCSPHIGHO2_01_FULL_40_10]
MKIKLTIKETILFLVCINIVFLILIFYLRNQIQENQVINISSPTNNVGLPYLKQSIEDLSISSKAYVIYNPGERAIVSSKNANFRFSPASTAKVMSSIIALEHYSLEKILIAKNVEQVEGSKMKLFEDENISVRNLLYGMLLPSGNDAAYVLSESFPGGKEAFVSAMNDKAKKLKLLNTKFVDPAGYDDNNYSTAYELARLASYAMENPEFRKIVSTKSISVFDATGQVEHTLINLNELLAIPGVNGVKTGFTNEAGGVLITSIAANTSNYIIVVLGSSDRFADTGNIIRNIVRNLTLISY